MMSTSRLPFAVAAIGASLALAACGGSASPRGAAPGTVVATDLAFQPREVRGQRDQPQTVRLDNRGKILHDWTVERISVVAVKAEGTAGHDMGAGGAGMMAPGAGGTMMGGAGAGAMMGGAGAGAAALHIAAAPGRVATVEFTPTEAGTYIFYCTVPGHREAGMEGTLIVS